MPFSIIAQQNQLARKALKHKRVSVDDVLRMFGPMPPGFRPSTLGRHLEQGNVQFVARQTLV